MDELTTQFLQDNIRFLHLMAALLLGALIGLERGWSARHQPPGQRIAGIRTHALTGLLGGLAAVLSETLTPLAFPVLLLALTLFALVAWRTRAQVVDDFSITGLVGLLLAFCLGAIAVAVDVVLAVAGAVITTLVLDNKQQIHDLLERLEAHELDAALKLLLISVVVLPLLPNDPLGPGGTLVPREIWWMVVLIASISFVGYFAIRVGGAEKGILFTGLFGGLSSSTALTLQFSRQSRLAEPLSPLLAAGVLFACGTMFPRVLIVATLINRDMLESLLLPATVMAALLYGPALWIWRRARRQRDFDQPQLDQNPLDLKSALLFGALLTLVMLLGDFLRDRFGDTGVYLLSATSGVADVDAINLSLARMAQESISVDTAATGIIIAAGVNNLVKSGIALVIGSRALALRVGVPMLVSMAAGLLVVLSI